jgi:hypothetical protein
VLVQIVANIFALLPYAAANAVAINSNLKNDPTIEAKVQLALTVLVVLYYITFALSFS